MIDLDSLQENGYKNENRKEKASGITCFLLHLT